MEGGGIPDRRRWGVHGERRELYERDLGERCHLGDQWERFVTVDSFGCHVYESVSSFLVLYQCSLRQRSTLEMRCNPDAYISPNNRPRKNSFCFSANYEESGARRNRLNDREALVGDRSGKDFAGYHFFWRSLSEWMKRCHFPEVERVHWSQWQIDMVKKCHQTTFHASFLVMNTELETMHCDRESWWGKRSEVLLNLWWYRCEKRRDRKYQDQRNLHIFCVSWARASVQESD